MNATRSQLKTQYERAKRLGWIEHFKAAAEQHTKGYFDTADLMGIGSRETNLDPKWLTKPGDGGHGYGLMQADDRSFPGWIATGEWKKAESGIHKGAEILMMKWRDMEENAGKLVQVKGRAFTMPKLKGLDAQQATIAAYNCGRWSFYAAAKGQDLDKYTTGRDYSADVMERASVFREFLKADGYLNSAAVPTASSEDQGDQTNSATASSEQGQPPNDQKPDKPPPDPQVLYKEKASAWSKAWGMVCSFFALLWSSVTGWYATDFAKPLINDARDKAANGLTMDILPQLALLFGVVIGIGVITVLFLWLGVWVWNHEKNRVASLNERKLEIASQPALATVEFTKDHQQATAVVQSNVT
jgi:hypothetical protein